MDKYSPAPTDAHPGREPRFGFSQPRAYADQPTPKFHTVRKRSLPKPWAAGVSGQFSKPPRVKMGVHRGEAPQIKIARQCEGAV